MSLPILTDVEVNALNDDLDPGFGCLQTPQGSLPLREMSVKTEIEGLVFHTRLRQVFVNPLTMPLEASYIFPLPERAAVTHFQIEINDRVVHGVIQERQQARQNYEQAIQTGQRAVITEEERAGVFTIRVGNLLPGETAILTLQLVGPLPFDGGEVTYRFPLVVAPRYIPGIPLPGESVGDGVSVDTDQVPDASRISPPTLLPGYPHPIQLSLAVTLKDQGFPLTQLRSSLHNVVTEASHEPAENKPINDEPIGQELTVRLLPGERLNRDFILRWQIGSDAVQTQLLITPDPEAFNAPPETGSGTFSLTVLPPTNLPKTSKPRDVVLLLDRSGSMKGWKIVAARRAAARMIDSLSEQDRFAVIAFDDRLEMPFQLSTNDLTPALDRLRYRAVEFLSRLEARGGTRMLSPLQKATQLLSHTERDPVLVLVTDAQVGNEDQMLRNLNLKGIRFFGVGIDQAVNAGWLTRLAQVSGGAWELVESEDRLDEVMTRLHQRINTPLVSDLQLEGEILSTTLVPKRLPALFAGTALTVSGRYQGSLQSLVLRASMPRAQLGNSRYPPNPAKIVLFLPSGRGDKYES
ncbi:MAG: VWA domain-containing protein [Synechococcaceae cyanobacterium SM2_3_2]|nr:VWA domain-containing protein [Synechococcaceae cyanobacterium SM2_3_2]